MRIGAAAGIFWVALIIGPAAAREAAPACTDAVRPDHLAGITAEGDLVLGSEGPARLVGLRLPDASSHRQEALDWLKARIGEPLLVSLQGPRDRWGRQPLRARLTRPQELDLGRGLVEAGLAIVDPGGDPVFCQPELFAIEETARAQRLGLWAEDRYNPILADQAERLKERVGSFVVVEGRVRSIGERRQKTYLNFGGHWAEDFTIIIPRKTWIRMAERGLSAASLKGRTLRARGILHSWQGTALTVDYPEMIERLEGAVLQGGGGGDKRLAR